MVGIGLRTKRERRDKEKRENVLRETITECLAMRVNWMWRDVVTSW